MPRPMRSITMENPAGGRMTMGHLMDRVYTRDQWMHRLDISDAIGAEPLITADHDRRIIEDVVAEWATLHPGPWSLELTGRPGDGPPRKTWERFAAASRGRYGEAFVWGRMGRSCPPREVTYRGRRSTVVLAPVRLGDG